MTERTLSIVIPYYNDRDHIIRCLQSIKESADMLENNQAVPDIVVVDDHSPVSFDPATAPISVTVCRLSLNRGVGAARNKGASLCKGSHILFIDSDVMLERHHLVRLYRLIETGEWKIVQGPTSVIPANSRASLFQQYLAAAWNYYEHGNWRISVFTQCFLIEKRFFLELGTFSERYERSGGEEFELGLRLNSLEQGIIRFDERLVHYHHFDHLVKRMKKVYLRSRHIGTIAMGMPNLPFRFTAQALMRSAFAWVLNGFFLLCLLNPFYGISGYLLTAALFYFSDHSFSKTMTQAQSLKLAWLSVVFRQLEFTFINLGMARGLFQRKSKEKS
jgi:glycosyltransferase involved in cell wall biosynthesis